MNAARSDSEHLVIVDFPAFMAVWFVLPILFGLWLLTTEIRENDLNLGKLIVGCIFLIIGGIAQFALLNRSIFDFDLQGRLVTWKRVGLLGRKSGTIAFDKIGYVYLEYHAGRGVMYRPVLQLESGILPLRLYSIHDDSQKICDAINKALGKPTRSMEEDIAVTVRYLLSRGDLDAAIWVLRRCLRLNSAQAGDYIKSLK